MATFTITTHTHFSISIFLQTAAVCVCQGGSMEWSWGWATVSSSSRGGSEGSKPALWDVIQTPPQQMCWAALSQPQLSLGVFLLGKQHLCRLPGILLSLTGVLPALFLHILLLLCLSIAPYTWEQFVWGLRSCVVGGRKNTNTRQTEIWSEFIDIK